MSNNEAVNQFLNRMPQDKSSSLGQLETAKIFIWFANKAFEMKYFYLLVL